MIKVGDKVKGFLFKSKDTGLEFNPGMYKFIGVEGEIVDIRERFDSFYVKFITHHQSRYWNETWAYPITKYLQMRREEKLKELGI